MIEKPEEGMLLATGSISYAGKAVGMMVFLRAEGRICVKNRNLISESPARK